MSLESVCSKRVQDFKGKKIESLYILLYVLIHALYASDSNKRVEFTHLFWDVVEGDGTISNRIWLSDEACFKLNAQINRHNCVY